jgi:hypothetical protein
MSKNEEEFSVRKRKQDKKEHKEKLIFLERMFKRTWQTVR